MRSTLLGVNGIYSDGTSSTDAMLRELRIRGHNTLDFNYPRTGVFMARFRWWQRRQARKLVEMHAQGDHVVAHSFGCLVVLRAMELGAQFGTVFLFAPAMGKKVTFPSKGAVRIQVIYNPQDKALKWARRLWHHDFGEMGRTGYRGPFDPRIGNYATVDDSDDMIGHSHYFSDDRINFWADHLDAVLELV